MVEFCPELESGSQQSKLEIYRRLVRQIKDWYEESYKKYSPLLTLESGFHAFYEGVFKNTIRLEFSENLSYNFAAKLSMFSVSDALVKLILSKYSYGMTASFLQRYGINSTQKNSKNDCWLTCSLNEFSMTEILAKVLREENAVYTFDLAALLIDRSERARLTHASEAVKCRSALRCYNTIRKMLVFLDYDYESTLDSFEEENTFNYDEFLSQPCNFNFDDYTTVLIAGSVHDVRKDYRSAIANLPWNMVLDYDGYSDCGGLLSALSHKQVQSSILTIDSARNLPIMSRGFTYWYRCGEYQMPFYTEQSISFPSLVPLDKGRYRQRKGDHLNSILELLFDHLKQMDRPINIVVALEDQFMIDHLFSVFKMLKYDEYYITWVGLSALKDYQHYFDGDQEDLDNHFRQFNCSSTMLYEAFAQHRESWKYRVNQNMEYTLPSSEGPVKIEDNNRIQLASYFDVLYDKVERIDADVLEEEQRAFDRGNQASWEVISSQYAVPLIQNSKIGSMKSQIRTVLGTTNRDKVQEKLFFISHKPGLGGSTLCRQLAWELHREYAVLVVQRYVQGDIVKCVKNLYDNVINRAPIILLADDSLPHLSNLCDDVKSLDRRCVLICACRQDNAILRENKNSKKEYLTSLTDSAVDQLKEHFITASPLESQLLKRRIQNFNREISGDLRTPFIIGLYFLEKEFSIESYVKKALDGCVERKYQDVLGYMAICNIYDYKYVPRSLINHAAALKYNELFHRIIPSAESIICQENVSDIDNLRFKHPLLSAEYLRQYSKRFYFGDERQAVSELTKKLIHDVATIHNLSENHLDLLRFILIQNKELMFDDPINSSRLLQFVGGDAPKELLNQLATEFEPAANIILQRGDNEPLTSLERALLRTVSHAYAHLGRIYSRIDRNPAKAEEKLSLALSYMPDEDPNIYHMLGCCRLDKLKQRKSEDLQQLQENPDHSIDYSEYEKLIQTAIEDFDYTSEYGSPDYGYPSKLRLIYTYLAFVYQVKHIRRSDDISQLSDEQRNLQEIFLHTLEEAKMLPQIGEMAQNSIQEYEDRYNSKIIFGNHAKAVEYYQNKLDTAHQRGALAEEDAMRRALVIARINLARAEVEPGKSFYRFVRNQTKLMDDIEALLRRPRSDNSYGERMFRNLLYHHWIQLAKLTKQSVEPVITRVRLWYDMEEEQDQRKNPEPYYYMRALLYLHALEGSKQAIEDAAAMEGKIKAYLKDGRFDTRRYNLNRIMDVLVDGVGLGQLFDVSFCKAEEDDYFLMIHEEGCTPRILTGRVDSIINDSLASLDSYEPSCWRHRIFYLKIGTAARNTMSKINVNDKVQFFAGFSVDRPWALSDTAKDIDKGENLSWYQEWIGISRRLLGTFKSDSDSSRLSKKRESTSKKAVVVEQNIAQMPNLAGKEVRVYPNNCNQLGEGTFEVNGTQYPVKLTPLKGKRKKKAVKAAKRGEPLTCEILGNATAKGYVAKIVN